MKIISEIIILYLFIIILPITFVFLIIGCSRAPENLAKRQQRYAKRQQGYAKRYAKRQQSYAKQQQNQLRQKPAPTPRQEATQGGWDMIKHELRKMTTRHKIDASPSKKLIQEKIKKTIEHRVLLIPRDLQNTEVTWVEVTKLI